MRSAPPWILASLCAAGVAAVPAAVCADELPPRIRVKPTDCPRLDAGAVQDQLNLELAGQVSSAEQRLDLELGVHCVGDRLVLSVTDPRTNRKLQREIPAPTPEHPEPGRVVALSASELFATAWLELLTAPPAEREPQANESATEDALLSAAPRPNPRSEVVTALGVRFRALPDLLPTGALELGYGFWVRPAWAVFARAALEFGATPRELGRVDAFAASLGAGAAWRSVRRGRVRLFVLATASASYLRLVGRTDRAEVRAGAVQGVAADLGLSVGPAIRLARVRLRVLLEGGYVASGPTGNVADGRRARATGGFVGLRTQIAIPIRHRNPR